MGKNWQQGERDVAAFCQSWWRAVEPKCVFCRTPRSGGWQHAKAPVFNAYGDVMADKETKLWPFVVEVKRRKKWTWKELINGRPSPVWEWWREVQRDAFRLTGDREPMLWVRPDKRVDNRKPPWLVLVRKELIEQVMSRSSGAVVWPDVVWQPRVLRQLNVGAPAVAYLGGRWLSQNPSLFAGL